MNRHKVIFNYDLDNFYVKRKAIADKIDEQALRDFIYQYQGTDITDFFFNVISQLVSYHPSKIRTTYCDKYLKTAELGQQVDYRDTFCKTAYTIWVEKGLNMYQIWLDCCREIGIRPWLSMRMNDAHNLTELPSVLANDSVYRHVIGHARIRHRKPFQYFDLLRDYEIPEERNEMLALTEEMLDRYDPYGIELDFQRDLDCFRIGREYHGVKIMTQYMRSVKEIVSKFEKKYGHKIKIAVRCLANPTYCLEMGFDILSWAKEGLIDLYISSPRFSSSNADMPIRLWKQMLSPYGVELACAIDVPTMVGGNCADTRHSNATTFGEVAYFQSQGADYSYLFNYFDDYNRMILDPKYRIPSKEEDWKTPVGYYRLLTSLGSAQKTKRQKRICRVNYEDKLPIWRQNYQPLPRRLAGEEDIAFFRICTGDIFEDQCVLRLGITEAVSGEKIELYLNTVPLRYSHKEAPVSDKTARGAECTYDTIYVFQIPEEAKEEDVQVLEVLSNNLYPMTLTYLDITATPTE